MLMTKSYSREFEPSPQYFFTNSGNVTTTSPLAVDIGTTYPASKKYLPLTDCEIVNNSASALILYPNQDTGRKIVIPAGVIKQISRGTVPAWTTLLIYTKTGTAGANEIEVTIWKTGVSADDMAQETHRKKSINRLGKIGW